MADIDAPRAYTIRFEGSGGAAGFVTGEARVTLTSESGGATTLGYAARAQVGGKLAQLGSRLIDGAAQKQADDFFARFVAAMSPPDAAATEPVAASRALPIRYAVIAVVIVVVVIVVPLAYLSFRIRQS